MRTRYLPISLLTCQDAAHWCAVGGVVWRPKCGQPDREGEGCYARSGDQHVVDLHRDADPVRSRDLWLHLVDRRPETFSDPQDRPYSREHVRRVWQPRAEAASTVLEGI